MRNKFDALNEIQGEHVKEYKFNYKFAFWLLVLLGIGSLLKWISLSI